MELIISPGHNSTAIVWICVDGLLRTKYIGMTYAFSEHHAPIVRGAKLFFPGDGALVNSTTSLAVGEFPGFFDPVVDTEVTLVIITSRKSHKFTAAGSN